MNNIIRNVIERIKTESPYNSYTDCTGDFVSGLCVNKNLTDTFKIHECYRNSIEYCLKAMLDIQDDYELQYVEGYMVLYNYIPIKHAWIQIRYFDKNRNVIDNKYIDPTLQFCLNKTVKEINFNTYLGQVILSKQEVIENLLKYKKYGPWK